MLLEIKAFLRRKEIAFVEGTGRPIDFKEVEHLFSAIGVSQDQPIADDSKGRRLAVAQEEGNPSFQEKEEKSFGKGIDLFPIIGRQKDSYLGGPVLSKNRGEGRKNLANEGKRRAGKGKDEAFAIGAKERGKPMPRGEEIVIQALVQMVIRTKKH